MLILHESFGRLMNGATVSGLLVNSTTGKQTDVAVEIQGLKQLDGVHRWDLQVLKRSGGSGEAVPLEVEVRWEHSTPVLVIENQTLPSVGPFSCRAVVYNHSVIASWKTSEQRGTFSGSLDPSRKSFEGKHFVIERMGEATRDWWTGSDWSDNPIDAKWYDQEPFATLETDDETAHTIYYPNGLVDQ